MKQTFNHSQNNNSQLFLGFLFLLTLFLTLVPFFRIGLTNCDDLDYYLTAITGKDYSEMYAHHAGRFYFLLTQPFYRLPYIFDSFYITKIIQYGFLTLSFILFAVVIRKIFKQTEFALSVFLLLLVFLTVTPNINMAIIAYPFYFTFSLSVFLLAVLMLLKYFETSKNGFLVVAVLFAAIALLFYENYLMFILVVVLFILLKNGSEQGWKLLKSKKVYKEVLPFVLLCVTYLGVYFLYRSSIQTEKGFYSGTTFAESFSISNFFTSIYSFNGAIIPSYLYHKKVLCLEANSLLAAGHQYNFWYVLRNSLPSSIVNALIQCFLFCFLFFNIKPEISWKKIGIGVLSSLFLLFAVHSLIAISEKYNAVHYRMDGYVTTYYAYFFMTVLIAFLAYASLKISYRNKYAKTSVISIFAFFFFYIAIITNYGNDHFSRDWQLNHGKQLMMEKIIAEGAFDNIPENAVIYLGNYNQTCSKFGSGIYYSLESYWAQYITAKIQKKLKIYADFEVFQKNVQKTQPSEIYYFTKYETQKNRDILLVISKLNNSYNIENTPVTANEATVYYYSPSKEFTLLMTIPEYSQNATVSVNNEIRRVSCGINALRIVNENKKKEITSFTLQSNAPFLVEDFAISNLGFLNEENNTCIEKP